MDVGKPPVVDESLAPVVQPVWEALRHAAAELDMLEKQRVELQDKIHQLRAMLDAVQPEKLNGKPKAKRRSRMLGVRDEQGKYKRSVAAWRVEKLVETLREQNKEMTSSELSEMLEWTGSTTDNTLWIAWDQGFVEAVTKPFPGRGGARRWKAKPIEEAQEVTG